MLPQRRAKQAEASEASRDVECSICMECVMEKADASERQFGLMACWHAFCLPCIRDWRSQLLSGDHQNTSRVFSCPAFSSRCSELCICP